LRVVLCGGNVVAAGVGTGLNLSWVYPQSPVNVGLQTVIRAREGTDGASISYFLPYFSFDTENARRGLQRVPFAFLGPLLIVTRDPSFPDVSPRLGCAVSSISLN